MTNRGSGKAERPAAGEEMLRDRPAVANDLAGNQLGTLTGRGTAPPRCMPEHKPMRRGREMFDLLTVEAPKPKQAKIRAVSYAAAIEQLFKCMRSSSSVLTQQAVSNPRRPVHNERRRRRPPRGRPMGTAGEWPPAPRRSPPVPARDGPGRGLPPRGRVRSR
jgi:hypothetical protein